MINKNIKKILNKNEIKKINNLNLELRPSKSNQKFFIALLNYSKCSESFFFSNIIIFSICLKQTSKFLLIKI